MSSKVPEDERRRLLHMWLEAISTAETFQKAQMVRHEKTCNWIFARPDFQDWASTTDANTRPKILWIHSGPGFGKTVLCANIISHLVEHDVPLVYFFCVADEETKRQPYAILRSWIDQLVHGNDDALNIAYAVYKSIETRAPTPTELWRLFETLGKYTYSATIVHAYTISTLMYLKADLMLSAAKAIDCTFVIDGFDECSTINKNSRSHTMDGRSEFLGLLIKNVTRTRARILIVSRDNEDIRAQLGTLTKDTIPMLFEYGISVNDTKDDIDHCSTEMVNTRLVNKPKELREYLASKAAEKSDGMFLWLHLLSHELDPGENAKRLRRIVSEMPAEINDTYERDLEKVQNLKPAQKARAIAILRWILFALRPLTVRELAEAIAMTVDASPDTYPLDELPDAWDQGYVDEQYVNSYIRRSCGSLVELRGQSENKPLALHTVHFVHFSVKEYLLRSDHLNNGQSRLERICFPDGGKEHNQLARLCLQYLCYDVFGEKNDFQDGRRIQVYPFLAYAAKSWYIHVLHDNRMAEDIMPWVEKLFNPSTSNWILWSKVFEGEMAFDDEPLTSCTLGEEGSSVNSTDESEELSDDYSQPGPIYYAALLGLTDLVKALQSQGLSCSAPGGTYGFPLQAAVRNSHQETVQYLVQQGIDINQRGGRYSLAICAAAALGYDKILDILVKAGADRKCEDDVGRTCLHFACKHGAKATVKPLLEAGLDPMKESKLGKTPFYEAVESGDYETVSLLLDAGANADDITRGTPAILRAASLGHEKIVEVLLNHNADVNVQNPSGQTCLHEAVLGDHIAIVHELLANSADIHTQDQDGWTALECAVAVYNVAIAEVLIGRGADVNRSNDGGWTPLHIAAEYADDKIMTMLLEGGAEVNAENSSSSTSLFSAVWARSLPCVKSLLAHGASVAKLNNMGSTVLDEAIESGDKDIIEWLLDHNALYGPTAHIEELNLSPLDLQRSTLAAQISKAILKREDKLALQLINSGGSALSQNNVDIALASCSLFNVPSIVESLLERGASFVPSTYNQRTPLHLAAKYSSPNLTKTFIGHGHPIQVVDVSGYTPLDLSLSNGLANLETTKYLLEGGALAAQSPGQDVTLAARTDPALEGRWEGTYTYNSWRKGDVEPTALTIRYDPSSLGSKHPFWKSEDDDEAGNFEILGTLLTNNTVRFLKLYESNGWLYLGDLDADAMVIRGTWGSSMTVRHGSFEIKKLTPQLSER